MKEEKGKIYTVCAFIEKPSETLRRNLRVLEGSKDFKNEKSAVRWAYRLFDKHEEEWPEMTVVIEETWWDGNRYNSATVAEISR